MDRDIRRRHDPLLGWCVAPVSGPCVESKNDLWRRAERVGLLDWPLDAAEIDPWDTKTEDKLGVTRTGDGLGLLGNNNYKVFEESAKAHGYKDVRTRRMAINSDENRRRANTSAQVGCNYMRHTTGSVYAFFDKPVKMWRGTTMAGILQDEVRHDPSCRVVGGYELENLALGLPFMAAFLDPGGWGREFTTAMDCYENITGM